ncbi:ASPIC/UnbV domain protein (plasmid) [Gemmatirosa kalamazoonensis]|uniref:ASPIC/UnbV domain protein n=1 Tax=Gemmatirosa kalamazoonensis TaxID=861299 RepID=W0RW34_9BACT|nr:VCBS repeat-containing protein [Gemmatirosa kalamazoonensis]AHG93778.1 ASPIC/UnbV domain protein [Gemmatirosa kalamazoonensis]
MLLLAAACRGAPATPPLFDRLAPGATGVSFANRLPETPDFNILSYLYYYNGGGVAVGDVNGDGLPDLYFTSNLGANRLYLNRGGFRFEDVTARAGVADSVGWKTGVTMADVNGDGRLDIFVSGVDYLGMHGRNVLYVNNGDGTFTDRASEVGLAQPGYSTQAAFFDYDGDGDLDALLLRHSTHGERAIAGAAKRDVHAERGGARLLRNDGGRFVDVSATAGIYGGSEGFGLGVVVSDVNGDGCPDVYVANDFQENDFLYVNRCDGTFAESIARATGHTSRFSMGVDAADFDNDLRPDLFVADMFPEREDVLKTSASSESWSLFNARLKAGYHPQYARNTLQWNRGDGRFSEIGLLAGVDATDWSWAPLFADLDNDGRKDLFVTSGVLRRPNDLDYITYVGGDAVQAMLARNDTSQTEILRHMPSVPVPSHVFRNEGGLRFTDVTQAWGLGTPGFANGAAYVDLDGDGALDLVVNEVNAPAAIYRNLARRSPATTNYLAVTLRGDSGNTAGIGAKLLVFAGGASQLVEQSPTRGFESSVDPRLHVGLGRATHADSVVVVWPDRRFQTLRGVAANQALVLAQRDAAGRWTYAVPHGAPLTVTDESARLAFDWRHVENAFSDFDREPLIPRLVSTEGPALAVGDVNGDGLDDLYLGGGKWQPGRLAVQRADGSFALVSDSAIATDSLNEDVSATFVDANGDGKLDLVVTSGGNEFWGDAPALAPRLYLNDGTGRFRRVTDAFPGVRENASCVVAADFDGDGDVDLFVGGRVVSRRYGEAPRSHLLRNDGTGHFTDVTRQLAPALERVGMVTSAAWADVDGDGVPDLVVVGEWMPVTVFRQDRAGGRFVDRTRESGLAGTAGWWSSVTAVDVTGDGRPDLVLGNLGRNAYVKASADEPARLYVHDFAHDGSLQQIVTFYKHGTSYPMAGRDEIVRAVPALRAKYPTYASFGAATVQDVFPRADLRAARVLEARTFESAVAVNDGHGAFALRPLPVEAQLAPVYASLARDFDGDGHVDLLLAGDFWGAPPLQGRYDASHGVLLRGLGDGRFRAVDEAGSGLAIDGQVRALGVVRGPGGPVVAVARNDDRPMLLRVSAPARRSVALGTRPAH